MRCISIGEWSLPSHLVAALHYILLEATQRHPTTAADSIWQCYLFIQSPLVTLEQQKKGDGEEEDGKKVFHWNLKCSALLTWFIHFQDARTLSLSFTIPCVFCARSVAWLFLVVIPSLFLVVVTTCNLMLFRLLFSDNSKTLLQKQKHTQHTESSADGLSIAFFHAFRSPFIFPQFIFGFCLLFVSRILLFRFGLLFVLAFCVHKQ